MKKLILLLLIVPMISFGQYSSYYGVVDVNANITVDKNVNINKNVNVNQTVTSIDYGALAQANATRERNRIESSKIANAREREAMIAIAENPMKAFDYGTDNRAILDKEQAESRGFKKGAVWYHKVPHKSLFTRTKGYNYRNTSEDGIIVELELGNISFLFGRKEVWGMSKAERNSYYNDWKPYLGNTEKMIKDQLKDLKVGELTDDGKYFTHKTDINKAKVYGRDGFVSTGVYEDDYEYVIKDNFSLILDNGFVVQAGVRYRGDKDEITFELLEGRRAYLKRLCNHIIATASLTPSKKGFNKSILD